MAMHPFLRRLLQWSGYICIATGFIGAVLGVVSVGLAFLVSPEQRWNYIGGGIGAFGGGFANVLAGYGFVWISRSGVDHPRT